MAETRSTCPYCGVGCGVIVESDGNRITGVRGDPAHPANFGRLCTKGSTLHLSAAPEVTRQARLLQPLHRLARGAAPQPIAWDAALDLAAGRIAATVQAHGADAVGLYLSGQLLTEDYYVFNKLARALLGSHQIDSNSRLCMSSAVAGYKATLGADAPPAGYDDIGTARTVFIAGSNTAWAHPVLMRRLEDAKRANPEQKWIVADPRRTETAALADLHLPLLPGTDVALFHGLLHLMLWEGLTDPAFIAAHTTGFDALRGLVREYTPKHVAELCGVREADIVQAARWFGGVDAQAPGGRWPTLSLYCQGLNQSTSGTEKNAALINLHLATGQIGKAGAGPLSLTGQPNAMGGRETGAMANLLPGHRDPGSAADRAELAALWGVPAIAARPGRTAMEMFEAAAEGEVKLLWIACTNPAQSLPHQAMVRRALARAEFVIVQEAFATTATAAFADLLLPAATWGEKDGTVTNSERRISRVRAAVAPAGDARPDWRIARDVGRRLEARLGPRRHDGGTLFPFESAEAVWLEHRETTRGRDLDIGGLDWAMLDLSPRQWPLPEGAAEGAVRLYTDGRFATADGRARFAAPAVRPLAQPRDARHPFALTTGRLRDQWHGMSRSGTLARLFAHDDEPAVELHPQDIERRGWRAGELVRVSSRQGQVVLPLRASESLRPAQAFVAMHWGEEFVGGHAADGSPFAGVNGLTTPARCPQSRQPELKHVAVRIEPARLPWRLVAAAWLPAGEVLAARETLRVLLPRFGYASCVPFGREPDAQLGVLLRAAAPAAVDEPLLQSIESTLGLAGAQALRYADAQRGQRRALRLAEGAGSLQAMLLAGDIAAETWVLPLLRARTPALAFGRALLSGRATPPQPLAAASPQVCNCFDVDEAAIVGVLADCRGGDELRLTQLQQRLRCGTQCGSCLPALRALVRVQRPTPAPAQFA